MARNQKDHYYRKAKDEGYRARSAYKLQQINYKFHIIRKGASVVDLGAAPGGWLQVAKELSGGMVVGVDLEEIEPIEGVTTFQADITEKETLKLVRDALLGPADVVICDAAPNLTGIWDVDHTKSIELSRSALKMALELLRPGGNFLVKTFQGDMFIQFLNEVKRDFSRVQAHSPAASRKESAEMYIVAKGLLSAPIRPGDVHDVLISSTGKDGDGIVEIMGFAVIVKGSGLGESVRVKIETVKHNFAFAKIIERL